jgi:hypothetical protein
MGNAKFYFYPQPDGRRQVNIDLGEKLGELFSDIQIDAMDSVTRDGSQFRSIGMNREIVTIQRDRLAGGEELAMKLMALQNHLDRGFSCSFSADDSYSWCYALSKRPESGESAIGVGPNPFQDMLGSITPQADQFMTIETESPLGIREIRQIQSSTVTSSAGGNISVKSPYINFTYPSRAMARWYRFWPVLRRPQSDVGKSIITNENGRLFSLNIRLVVDLAGMFSFFNVFNGSFIPKIVLPSTTNTVPPSQYTGGGKGRNEWGWPPDNKWDTIDRPEDLDKTGEDIGDFTGGVDF